MNTKEKVNRWTVWGLLAALLVGTLPLFVGCQLSQNGQTLPSPYYLDNKIQYFPAGNEFQYQEEVDRMKRVEADKNLDQTGVWQRYQQQ
ncbi:MAG: hypothetical protein IIZ25_10825 [Thermoguttaceae bacterium]|nr:hypothetical protein [Thermoguttaceae bacterium]